MEGLIGRWAANIERVARLLSKADGIQLDNPQFLSSRKVGPIEAEALQKRRFRRLRPAKG
jgi:hypothetical protein